ncbi:hypothetical protein EZH24_03730 [Brachyspira catarrhinii]|uniref:Uncharacterized protein n=1 Tax=Brachyspira catarrhinii TaxID=2528966 RepID=A0ABY2TSL2_9SPIR|nr:hypothetical protein EZH24_03730 [Brachyspira catarrhinii]
MTKMFCFQKIKNKQYIEIVGNIENLQPKNAIKTIDNFFHSHGKNLKEFKNLTDEISHFEKFSSALDLTIIDENNKGNIVYAIRHKSEKEFLKDLQSYLSKANNELKNYEWHFCRLIENADNIFYSFFIFWIKKKEEFIILFIDPKGLEIGVGNAENKLQGFKNIFENKNFEYQGQKVKAKLIYYNKLGTNNKSLEKYTKSSCKDIFNSLN